MLDDEGVEVFDGVVFFFVDVVFAFFLVPHQNAHQNTSKNTPKFKRHAPRLHQAQLMWFWCDNDANLLRFDVELCVTVPLAFLGFPSNPHQTTSNSHQK